MQKKIKISFLSLRRNLLLIYYILEEKKKHEKLLTLVHKGHRITLEQKKKFTGVVRENLQVSHNYKECDKLTEQMSTLRSEKET